MKKARTIVPLYRNVYRITHRIAGISHADNPQPSSYREGSTTIPFGSTLKRVEVVGILLGMMR